MTQDPKPKPPEKNPEKGSAVVPKADATQPRPKPLGETAKPPAETGGPKGPEPTRYGDWEQKGRCTDF